MLLFLLLCAIYSVIFVFILNYFPSLFFPYLIFPFVAGLLLSAISETGPWYEKLIITIAVPFALLIVFC